MPEKKLYSNGQPIFEMDGDRRTYYYKSGKKRAEGKFINSMMEGEWIFYRETGQLWQTGNFRNNKKHGEFTRYDKNDHVEYQETFENNRIIPKNAARTKK
jgi:antitoxin component YwqK of YwqJK toxin-antitoxin module